MGHFNKTVRKIRHAAIAASTVFWTLPVTAYAESKTEFAGGINSGSGSTGEQAAKKIYTIDTALGHLISYIGAIIFVIGIIKFIFSIKDEDANGKQRSIIVIATGFLLLFISAVLKQIFQ